MCEGKNKSAGREKQQSFEHTELTAPPIQMQFRDPGARKAAGLGMQAHILAHQFIFTPMEKGFTWVSLNVREPISKVEKKRWPKRGRFPF